MANGKVFHWLKLQENFFRGVKMKRLRQIAGGETYTIIYLKLQLYSLQYEGKLIYEGVGENFEDELALAIDEDVNNVKATLLYLRHVHLLEEISSNEMLLTEVPFLIGSETEAAERMRKLRKKRSDCEALAEQSANNVRTAFTELEVESDKKQDIEREVEVAASAPPTSSIPCPFEEIQKLWNDICVSLPHVDYIQCERRKLVQERWNEYPSLDKFEEVFRKVEASRFLKGDNKKNWIIQFNWLMKSDHFTKTLEGNYDDYKAPRDPNSSFDLDDLMDEIRKQYQD